MVTSSIQDILMMYTWEDDKDLTSTQEIIDYARPKLFDFHYPIYDDNMKQQFEEDFIRHFYTREIGSESIALFKLRLQDYLYLNNEKWERLYQSIDAELNPFANIDFKVTRATNENEKNDTTASEDENRSGTVDQTSKDELSKTTDNTTNEENESIQQTDGTTHADDFTRNLESVTPDERLNITAQDGVGLIEYASHIEESKNTNDSEQNVTVGSTSQRDTTGNTTETGVTDSIGNEQREEERKRNSLEEQLRSFEQALDEHRIGRMWNKSFVEVYDEYITHFQGLHRLMFKEMEKLFLGVF